MSKYTFSVIRFASNPSAGETLNIGAVYFSESGQFARVVPFDLNRIQAAFGAHAGLSASSFLSSLAASISAEGSVTKIEQVLARYPDQGTSVTFGAVKAITLPVGLEIEEVLTSMYVPSVAPASPFEIGVANSETASARKRSARQVVYPKLVPGT